MLRITHNYGFLSPSHLYKLWRRNLVISLRVLIRLQKGYVPTYYELPLVCCDGRVLFRPCDCYSLGAKYKGCACESRHTQIQYAIYRIVAQYGGHSAVKRFSTKASIELLQYIGWVCIGWCERTKLFRLNFPFHWELWNEIQS